MGFVVHPFTETKKERWEAEGRGTGHDATYRAWLMEGDMPADSGTLDRFVCSLSGRMAITFSSIEQRGRQYYEIARGTQEIRERVPLDREETRSIARALGIPHPKDGDSGTDYVMTRQTQRSSLSSRKPTLRRSVRSSLLRIGGSRAPRDLSDAIGSVGGELPRRERPQGRRGQRRPALPDFLQAPHR